MRKTSISVVFAVALAGCTTTWSVVAIEIQNQVLKICGVLPDPAAVSVLFRELNDVAAVAETVCKAFKWAEENKVFGAVVPDGSAQGVITNQIEGTVGRTTVVGRIINPSALEAFEAQ